MKGRRKNLL